jgi:hypothetical protein
VSAPTPTPDDEATATLQAMLAWLEGWERREAVMPAKRKGKRRA